MDSQAGRKRIVTVLGTRPEIIKCSTLIRDFDMTFDHLLVHTGQHYDDLMDATFFRELALRPPDYNLRVGSGAPGSQLACMLLGLEPILTEFAPDAVFVQGDTNSTLAGALMAAKLSVPVIHLEAGCRSFNRAMPEEINRVVVDHLAALCLAPDATAQRHLRNEGIDEEQIVVVGSTAIDACLRSSELESGDDVAAELGFAPGSFLVATIHRAENTTPERLGGLLAALEDLSASWPVVFPVHPRTAAALGTMPRSGAIHWIEPVGYTRMMQLLRACRGLLTDSGGLQEEAAVLGAPTFVLRDETEWQEFVDAGHHMLVGTEPGIITSAVRDTLTGGARERRMRVPIGRERAGATTRALAAITQFLGTGASKEIPSLWIRHASTPLEEPQSIAGARDLVQVKV
jgi:UDP-N-acetylglucosamine 2-epimerase (non-hydrolysing)